MNPTIKVIAPQGILDGTKATDFRSQIDRSVSNGAEIILVDFTDVTFMDSSGLGALVLALKTIRGAGLKMFLCSMNEQTRMLFELTSMDRVFEIFTDKEEFEQKFL
ncbi:Anti-sigma factor antagonist [Hyella patelloides LEGE 07179]|uniref:Anti-sigma factor antagonist n=1 Tax=Hyella patelloides LEGE 07179 TaxID=945734 RepID=A0A563VKW5_9CYAN|nr:STAS domain-containing protein [Hyella patelloides]VEP11973.1 Anti-sigma factor antagonist [Hyella patelloides LEGE 07179]